MTDFLHFAEEKDPDPRTSQYVRAIVRVRRLEESGYSEFEVSVRPRTRDWRMADWVCEEGEPIARQIPRAQSLKVGQAASIEVVLKPWSSKYWTDCGYEYDGGVDVVKVRRTLRCSRAPRHE